MTTPLSIIAEVCEVSVEDITGRARPNYISDARLIWYYVLILSHKSYSHVARITQRNHGAIISGLRRVDALRETCPRFRAKMERVMTRIQSETV